MFAENLDVFLREFGLPCSVAAQAFIGILSQPDEQMLMAGVNVMSTMYELTVKSSDVSALTIKSKTVIVVAGINYEVRDVMLLDDGAFTKLTVSKV
jgi:hypothetical protein